MPNTVPAKLYVNYWGTNLFGTGEGGRYKFDAATTADFVVHNLEVDGRQLQSPCAPVCVERIAFNLKTDAVLRDTGAAPAAMLSLTLVAISSILLY
eukprot:2812350-Prymnesium_polylepis.1